MRRTRCNAVVSCSNRDDWRSLARSSAAWAACAGAPASGSTARTTFTGRALVQKVLLQAPRDEPFGLRKRVGGDGHGLVPGGEGQAVPDRDRREARDVPQDRGQRERGAAKPERVGASGRRRPDGEQPGQQVEPVGGGEDGPGDRAGQRAPAERAAPSRAGPARRPRPHGAAGVLAGHRPGEAGQLDDHGRGQVELRERGGAAQRGALLVGEAETVARSAASAAMRDDRSAIDPSRSVNVSLPSPSLICSGVLLRSCRKKNDASS